MLLAPLCTRLRLAGWTWFERNGVRNTPSHSNAAQPPLLNRFSLCYFKTFLECVSLYLEHDFEVRLKSLLFKNNHIKVGTNRDFLIRIGVDFQGVLK